MPWQWLPLPSPAKRMNLSININKWFYSAKTVLGVSFEYFTRRSLSRSLRILPFAYPLSLKKNTNYILVANPRRINLIPKYRRDPIIPCVIFWKKLAHTWIWISLPAISAKDLQPSRIHPIWKNIQHPQNSMISSTTTKVSYIWI